METRAMILDADQLNSVESTAPSTFCLSGPGSGKSRCIVERIKHIVATGTAPASVWCMTFTVSGACELKDRLGSIRLGNLGTRHSILFKILQRYGGTIGYREGGINLCPEDLAEELLQAEAKFLRYKGSDKALREAKKPDALLVQRSFQHRLKTSNLVTYDGVLTDGLRLLKSDAEIPMPAALIIDEAQDDALVDWEITAAMQDRRPDMTLFVAGDEKQSIFRWRGAYPKGFTDAAARAHVIKLQRNYRSGSAITEAATRLISHNSGLVAAETISATGTVGSIRYDRYATDVQERNAVAGTISSRLADGAYNPGDFAILCRTNALARSFRDALAAGGVPVRSKAQEKLPPDFGHALDVLSLFADPRSDIIAERVLKRMGAYDLRVIKAKAMETGQWLSTVAFPETIVRSWEERSPFAEIMELLPRYDISKETCDLVAARIALLPQPEPTLADLRHDLFAGMQHGFGDRSEKQDGCWVGTYHAAKGLEWPVVFLPAVEEGIIPSLRADTAIEEERRLFFVGITRAAHQCHISSAGTRVFEWGGAKPMQPSRFIAEAGL